uniref:arginine--tRNA ligase n=1 Tax=Albugo laibachii Nc14 TaxID=890382 RepID=F0WHS5_9STRA|nr:arginyltRNA synthetase putative [Albugo laibachii Nc14]|eukprot:CCA20800.1 arginyltRNA synthetase putative [Albugo laibachii Nc14]
MPKSSVHSINIRTTFMHQWWPMGFLVRDFQHRLRLQNSFSLQTRTLHNNLPSHSIIQAISRLLSQSLSSINDASISREKLTPQLGIRRSTQPKIDFQSNIALILAHSSPYNALQPSEIAHKLLENLPSEPRILQAASVSPAGFLNFTLCDRFLARFVHEMASHNEPQHSEESRSILVDFASPNYGKKLHVGHLRSSVIGDTICNLLEYRGHKVARVSHSGDLGSAMATLLASIVTEKESYALMRNDSQLAAMYERGKMQLARDKTGGFTSLVKHIVLLLQQPENPSSTFHRDILAMWRHICALSQDSYQRIFERLNVSVENRPESSYIRMIHPVLEDLKSRGIITRSQGADCIFVSPQLPPLIVRKKDGGFLYATIDLACLYCRLFGSEIDATRYNEIIYVTDQSQSLHFQQLFLAAQRAEWIGKSSKVELHHVAFGLVLGSDGSKLSSRNGAFDYLEDLLDTAAIECQNRSILPSNELEKRAGKELFCRIGDAAVRYFELSQQRTRDYKFTWDQALSFKGNTGVYLLYACARLEGILRKLHQELDYEVLSREKSTKELLTASSAHWQSSERALALILAQMEDEVSTATTHLTPHTLCEYLYRVASHFHAFYEDCRVVGVPEMEARLCLCALTWKILTRGLHLLGIEPVDRM